MEIGKALKPESVLVAEYVRGSFVPLSRLAHGWEMHSAISLTPAEERVIIREPAKAIPAAIAERVGELRALIVPFIACMESGDRVCFTKPEGETHTSVWEESEARLHLVLSCRELNPHDTGFEFLASIGELLRPRLTESELERYTQMLEEEMRGGIAGEIDEDARTAKELLLPGRGRRPRRGEKFAEYRDISFVSTAAEYMHGLWHDVQIRVGPEHLPLPQLRRRMRLLAEMFPPNPGYSVFATELSEE